MALVPTEIKIEVTGMEQFKGLCKCFERFCDRVENVEAFLCTKPNQERQVAADQLKEARQEFLSLLEEIGA